MSRFQQHYFHCVTVMLIYYTKTARRDQVWIGAKSQNVVKLCKISPALTHVNLWTLVSCGPVTSGRSENRRFLPAVLIRRHDVHVCKPLLLLVAPPFITLTSQVQSLFILRPLSTTSTGALIFPFWRSCVHHWFHSIFSPPLMSLLSSHLLLHLILAIVLSLSPLSTMSVQLRVRRTHSFFWLFFFFLNETPVMFLLVRKDIYGSLHSWKESGGEGEGWAKDKCHTWRNGCEGNVWR